MFFSVKSELSWLTSFDQKKTNEKLTLKVLLNTIFKHIHSQIYNWNENSGVEVRQNATYVQNIQSNLKTLLVIHKLTDMEIKHFFIQFRWVENSGKLWK